MSNNRTPRPFANYHCVGFTKSAHGLRGELYVQLYAKHADWLDSLKNIYFLLPGESALKEFTCEFCRPHKEGLILKVKGCDDRNMSEGLRKSGVYIPEALLVADEGEGIFLKQILNFDLIDAADVKIGTVTGFATNGAQDLLRVQTTQGEGLVPFVEAFLVKIDFDKRTVKMDLPPGLFSLEEE